MQSSCRAKEQTLRSRLFGLQAYKLKKNFNCSHIYLKCEELLKIKIIFAFKIKLVFLLVIKGHQVIFCYNLVLSLQVLLAAFL